MDLPIKLVHVIGGYTASYKIAKKSLTKLRVALTGVDTQFYDFSVFIFYTVGRKGLEIVF